MNDQTRHRIDEVIGTNKARKYEDDTKKLIDKWISKCPVKIIKREDPTYLLKAIKNNIEIIMDIQQEPKINLAINTSSK